MSEINSFSEYTNQYNTNADYSLLLNGSASEASGSSFSLSDYASIKNGSYKKLLKTYYAKQDAEKAAGTKDTSQRLTMMKSSADSLKKAADVLKTDSLWEKKKITKKDEKTGAETEVEAYDWEAITKAVKSFVEAYNDVVDESGKSNTKDVLRNAAWMTNITSKTENLLAKIGIQIGKGNKLELDEDAIKKSDINVLKTLFQGHNSFANQISYKADRIGNAASRAGSGYTSNGTYSNASTSDAASKIDEEA